MPEIHDRFMEIFGREVQASGSMFFGLDPNAKHFTAHLSASRGVWPRPGEHLAVENLLPLGMRRHLGMYKELRSQFYHDKLCCDVSQNPSSRRRCGDWLPVVAKSSVMVLIDGSCQAQLMTPAEVDFSMGWPSLPCARSFSTATSYDLSTLTPREQNSLAGNGMHLGVLAAWFTFIAMHSIRRDVVNQLAKTLTSPIPEDDEASFEFE